MIQKIRKRDGRIVDFDSSKVISAISKAKHAVGEENHISAEELAKKVIETLEKDYKRKIPTVEEIQDTVEGILMQEEQTKTAKAYILYRHARSLERAKRALILGEGKADDNLNFTNNALQVLERRYLIKDETNNLIETPKQMVRRVAHNIAQAEYNYGASEEEALKIEEEFYNLLADLDFLPNSPTLMSAGTPLQQLSGCFVIPVEDTMEGIFKAVTDAAIINKSGGGTGFSFSRLRPKNDIVQSTSGVASGPISFMKVFDVTTDVIKQGGKRRGANMGALKVDHPDIMDFIECKADMQSMTNFNISVAATDKFMKAVKDEKDYNLLNPRTKKPQGKLHARDVFSMIIRNAWKNGDPGMIFLDTVNKKHPAKNVGEIETTNPCGEEPLLPYESCNLGSINLNNFVNEKRTDIDWDKLKTTVRLCTRFLDNVIDMNEYPISEIEEATKKTRKIGLGIMGFADALYNLNIKYDSEQGLKMAEKIMKFIKNESYSMSEELAKSRGTYPTWKGSDHEKAGRKMRNACCLTIAPTGTLSMLADVSGGCEPVFAISFIKNVMDGTEMIYTNKVFEKVAKEKGFYTPDLMRSIAQIGKVEGIKEIPKDVRDVFITAQEIAPEWHVRMQATFQKYIDASISKTVNFPNSATISDVEKVYLLAWELGCKGVTIYRDGSRDNQVLNIGEVKGKITESTTAVEDSAKKLEENPKKDKACRVEVKDGRIVKTCE